MRTIIRAVAVVAIVVVRRSRAGHETDDAERRTSDSGAADASSVVAMVALVPGA